MKFQYKTFFLCLLLLSACATYSGRVSEARRSFEYSEYDLAIEELKKLVERHDKDELLYLMDLGLVYHTAGRYKEAIETFSLADKMAEVKDYTSVTEETASIITNDEAKTYKGDDYEKILINVYLAMGYTLLGLWEDALVEARRVNQKIDKMISEGKLPYDRNGFAKYLAASLFEARHEFNDAFVDYRQLHKWIGEWSYLGVPILRMADRLKASQEFDEYKVKFPGIKKYKLGKGEGEVILLLEQGKVPIKVSAPEFRLMPKMRKRH